MTRWVSSTVAAALLLAPWGAARGQDADKARAIIERAVKAQGGVEKLSLELAGHRKSKGRFVGENFSFDGDSFSEPGGKRRLVLKGVMNDVPTTRQLVLVEKKGWISYDGVVYDLDAKFLERIERSAYADRVCGLVTLLKDKAYTLTLTGEAQVKGKAAVGIKVARDGKPDVSLWFDKDSGLLVKSANKTPEANSDQEVYQEAYYSDYRLIDPAGPDERRLKAAKLAVDGAGLLEFLRQRTPDEEEQVRIKDLIAKLGHKSFAMREKASAAVRRHGVKAAALLRQAAASSDNETARRADQALTHVAPADELELTAAALRLVALRKPAQSAEVLLGYVPWAPNDKARHETYAALAALAAGDGKPHPAIAAALKDHDPQRRAAAAAALGKDGGAFVKTGWRRVHVEGLRLPMTTALYREGAHFMDIQTLDILFYNRLDDSLFTRP